MYHQFQSNQITMTELRFFRRWIQTQCTPVDKLWWKRKPRIVPPEFKADQTRHIIRRVVSQTVTQSLPRPIDFSSTCVVFRHVFKLVDHLLFLYFIIPILFVLIYDQSSSVTTLMSHLFWEDWCKSCEWVTSPLIFVRLRANWGNTVRKTLPKRVTTVEDGRTEFAYLRPLNRLPRFSEFYEHQVMLLLTGVFRIR